MPRTLVSSGSPWEPVFGFSRAVRVGNVIAVAGTAAIAEDGSAACPGDPAGQARRCLEIIAQALTKAGGGMEHVVRTRVLLTNAAHWPAVAKVHGEVFGEVRPACTVAVVTGFLEREWLVEIEVDAVVEG
ncbi:MAG: RidA family protein [Pseudomonadota bacterium]